MPRSRDARIRDMYQAAQLAVETCAERTRRDLDTDPVLYAATTRWIEILGEAAKHIDPADIAP